MQESGEPSVEEILDSIKKVIARDAQTGTMQDRRENARSPRKASDARVDPAHKDEARDVLELGEASIFVDTPPESYTRAADDDGKGRQAVPLSQNEGEPLTLESEMEELAAEAERETEERTERRGQQPAPLTRSEVRGQAKANFATLASLMAAPGDNADSAASETSLEGLVREMLRPMLAQWLDEHLPGMVQEMVQAEINRITSEV